MSESREISQADVNEKAAVQSKSMTEADFQSVNPHGHQRQYRPDGSYTWTNDWQTNDNGDLTREANAIADGMGAFIRADNDRFGALQEKVERTKVIDPLGQVHYLEAAQEGDVSRRGGWRPAWRATGLITRSGPEGMDFQFYLGRWNPTGRKLYRGEHVPIEPVGAQHDPAGNSWIYRCGEWVEA
jgi:hypothetical protein